MKVVQVFPMLNVYFVCGDNAQVLLANSDEEGNLTPGNTRTGSVERWLAELPPMTAAFNPELMVVGRIDEDRYAVWADVLAMGGATKESIVEALDALRLHLAGCRL